MSSLQITEGVEDSSKGLNPTKQTYEELERAFDFFNAELFGNQLPRPMLTLQRQANSVGYFSPHQFQNSEKAQVHEIALNPSYFGLRSIQETLSVLAREMVSLDQALHSEKQPRLRYRNKEWAAKCQSIGLMPSDTGQPGGKQTGDGVGTYIIAGGPFDIACSKLVDEAFTIHWFDRYPPLSLVIEATAQADSASHGLHSLPVGEPLEGLEHTLALDEVVQGQVAESQSKDASLSTLQIDAVPEAHGSGESIAAASGSGHKGPPPPPMKHFDSVNREQLESMGIQPKDSGKSASKTKYNCSSCNANTWGKPTLRLLCIGTDLAEHEPFRMTPEV